MTLPEELSASAVTTLRPLVRAEATAEAPAAAMDAADLEQAVWLRLLETLKDSGPPLDAARWVRSAVRAEARRARRAAIRERPIDGTAPEPSGDIGQGPEGTALRAERHRALWAAVARAPGNCPKLLAAMLSPDDPTYREIAGELGISQGSLGPMRSRCLGCLRRMLAVEVGAPALGGKER
ncbi:sigma-70 family RNA polymerase sigma factor [Streptomyces albipurpureus]|uniref:Sigma-70 family RNA polymerase sigma factor n=1 Tax=Streptomyces albipurpureus TaxID=2897419 RepID=A0ABT0UPI4_9ACTN|nr:sigma-70 family RNA polymerase sigma factor [Streptomyces sp. CWNU-1]MCM2390453.1 sigma-70 family RNA polymerase sigma factor [Streptomyces sp. CWNU-1]